MATPQALPPAIPDRAIYSAADLCEQCRPKAKSRRFTTKQERYIEALANGAESYAEAARTAEISPRTAVRLSQDGTVLREVQARAAKKVDKARAIKRMAAEKVAKALETDVDGEYALKALAVSAQVLKDEPAEDDSPDKWDHRDLDKYRRRLSLRMLRYALRTPHRARTLADQLARAIGESPHEYIDVNEVRAVSD